MIEEPKLLKEILENKEKMKTGRSEAVPNIKEEPALEHFPNKNASIQRNALILTNLLKYEQDDQLDKLKGISDTYLLTHKLIVNRIKNSDN